MSIDQAVDVINKLRTNGKLTEQEYSDAVAFIVDKCVADSGYYE